MTSVADLVAQLVASSGVEQTASGAADEALLARMSDSGGAHDDVIALARSGAILETEGLAAYRAATAGGSDADDHRSRAETYFAQAGSCARLIAEMRRHGSDATSANEDVLPAGLDLPVRIAAAGLVSRHTADVRLELGPLVVRGEDVAASVPGYSTEDLDWEQRLLVDTFGAFVLLVRKRDGWDDVNAAVDALGRLREAQAEQQPTFLARAAERGEQESSAARLVALFHLAQSVTLVGSYLRTGRGSSPALMSRLDRHRDQALNGLAVAGRIGDDLRQISELLWVGCRELVRNSIWSHVDGLGAQLTELAKHLADPGRERPVLELWPSQQRH